MGGGVSKDRLEELRREFNSMDSDDNNDVSLEELRKAHRKHDGDAFDEAKCLTEFNKLDKNHDGRVQLHEYLEAFGVKHAAAMVAEQEESVKRAMSVLEEEDRRGSNGGFRFSGGRCVLPSLLVRRCLRMRRLRAVSDASLTHLLCCLQTASMSCCSVIIARSPRS